MSCYFLINRRHTTFSSTSSLHYSPSFKITPSSNYRSHCSPSHTMPFSYSASHPTSPDLIRYRLLFLFLLLMLLLLLAPYTSSFYSTTPHLILPPPPPHCTLHHIHLPTPPPHLRRSPPPQTTPHTTSFFSTSPLFCFLLFLLLHRLLLHTLHRRKHLQQEIVYPLRATGSDRR